MYLKHCAEALENMSCQTPVYTPWPYLQACAVLLLLFVYYPEAEVDLVGLLEVRLHFHDLRERLLRVVVGSVSIVEDSYSVPKFRFLQYGLDSLPSKLKGEWGFHVPFDWRDSQWRFGTPHKPVATHPS